MRCAGTRPHIRREDSLWVCRGGGSPAGYGFKPHQALREWTLMHLYPGKPAGAQEAQPTTPSLMAHLGAPVEDRHVPNPA